MIDIHSHILPGMDDGPGTMQESIAMARTAFADGIRTIIATPHTCNGTSSCHPQDIIGSCKTLNAALEKNNLAINILPGSEVCLCPELIENYKQNKIMMLNNGSFMLLEMPHQFIVKSVIDMIKTFKLQGITTIIAHPERNRGVINNLDVVDQFIFAGGLIQITSGSLLGLFGRRARNTARALIRKENVHFLATDAHSVKKRPPVLSDGAKQLEKIVGVKSKNILVQNPEMVLSKPVTLFAESNEI